MKYLLTLFLVLLTHAETAQQLALRGRELKAKGDAAGALAAYEQAAALSPKSAELQDEIGFLLAVLQRSDEALARFQKAIELDPKFAPAHYHLGVAYWLRNDQERGVSELQMAATLGPKVYDYRYRL